MDLFAASVTTRNITDSEFPTIDEDLLVRFKHDFIERAEMPRGYHVLCNSREGGATEFRRISHRREAISEPSPSPRIAGNATIRINWTSVTRASSLSSTRVSAASELCRRLLRDRRIMRLSPERRAIYESIRKLREEIGPVDFNVVEELRELRKNV